MTEIQIPTLLTINETAERTGLSRHFIRTLCVTNKIRTIKAGNKYLINLDKFMEFLNNQNSDEFVRASIIRQMQKRMNKEKTEFIEPIGDYLTMKIYNYLINESEKNNDSTK